MRLFRLCILSIVLSLACFCYAADDVANAGAPSPHILLLHSYHQGMMWVDEVTDGFVSTLRKSHPQAELHVEYMDTKRVKGEEYLANLYRTYRGKYSSEKFDVVVVADDIAFQFLLRHPDLFPKVPVVFCGLNNFDPEMLKKREKLTGVLEKISVTENIDLILRLHPGTERIYIINDTTETGKGLHREIAAGIAPFAARVSFTFLEDYTTSELAGVVSRLPRNSIILRSAFFRDGAGKPLPNERYAFAAIDSHATVPEYGLWDTYFRLGIVGGELVSGIAHGETAARMVARILEGEPTENIPIETRSPNRFMFDYRQMERFGISLASLPPGSIIINRPRGFYAVNKTVAWTGGILGAVLAGTVVLLVWNIRKRRYVEVSLRESEAKFRDLFNCAGDAILVHDMEGNFIQVNEGACRMLRYEPGEILRRHLSEIDAPSQTQFIPERLSQLKETGQAFFESIHVRRDGIHIPVEVNSRTVHVAGKPAILSVVREITARKLAEEALRRSEERLRVIFDASQAGIALISAEGKITYANNRLADLFGCSLERLVGSSYFDYVDPAERDESVLAFNIMVDGRIAHKTNERHYIAMDGHEFWGYFSGRRLNRADGSLDSIVVIISDVSELKLTKEDLKQEKERLSVTLRSIGDGVISVDTGGNVVMMNNVAEELCGWSDEEAHGKPLMEVFNILRDKTRDRQENPVERALATASIVELANHTVLVSRDGAERIIEDSAAPIRDHSGAIVGAVLVFRDTTEKKRIEEDLFRSQKLESLGVLAGGIAHDFNNLLTGILGNISMAMHTIPESHRANDALLRAQKASERAGDLTQQLLTFSKGGAPVKKLTSLVHVLLDSANFALHGADVHCTFDIAHDLWPAEIDAGQMSQVIHNLVINADQAMPDGGEVLISAVNIPAGESGPEAASLVQITISDQGTGIPQEHLSRIFDPYYSTKENGTGLGLATVHSIIRNHDGQISVSSSLGVGTTFTIRLPAARDVVPHSPASPQDIPAGEGRVLVMDDDELVREVATNILTLLGYEPEECEDGEMAIDAYQRALSEQRPFAAVIMDLTIPGGMGGREAVRRLLEIDPDACVIVSSGYSSDKVIANHRHYGFCGAILKPYRMEDLGVILHRVLHDLQ